MTRSDVICAGAQILKDSFGTDTWAVVTHVKTQRCHISSFDDADL